MGARNRGIASTVQQVNQERLTTRVQLDDFKRNNSGIGSATQQLGAFATNPTNVAHRTSLVNRSGQRLTSVTLNNTPEASGLVDRAATSMAREAQLGKNKSLNAAQRAWLADIMQPTWSQPTHGAAVMGHLQTARRLEESSRVFDTIAMAAQNNFPADFSVVSKRGRVQGLMQSTNLDWAGRQTDNTAIGFLGTHPRNIRNPQRTPGVGSAMIGHARELARVNNSRAITLGAEGAEAQGFYRHQGFQHEDGRALLPQHFSHRTLPLKLPLR